MRTPRSALIGFAVRCISGRVYLYPHQLLLLAILVVVYLILIFVKIDGSLIPDDGLAAKIFSADAALSRRIDWRKSFRLVDISICGMRMDSASMFLVVLDSVLSTALLH